MLFAWKYHVVPLLHLSDLFEVRFKSVTIPHVFIGKSLVPLIDIRVFALNSVVGQMQRFVKIFQAEYLGTESKVIFPATNPLFSSRPNESRF